MAAAAPDTRKLPGELCCYPYQGGMGVDGWLQGRFRWVAGEFLALPRPFPLQVTRLETYRNYVNIDVPIDTIKNDCKDVEKVLRSCVRPLACAMLLCCLSMWSP